MTNRTYAQLMKQIDGLQKEADAARQREVKAVISRIKDAISSYNLTAADLGLAPARAGRSAKASKVARKRSAGRVRYRDQAGNTWSGHGRRPKWFLDAIAAGATPQSLSAK